MKTPRKKLEKKADKLFGEIVRSRGKCERCGSKDFLQTAHLISRRYKQVRWDLDNAFCLCRNHHVYFTHHPIEWDLYVEDKIGTTLYKTLKTRALIYGKIRYEEIIKDLEMRREGLQESSRAN